VRGRSIWRAAGLLLLGAFAAAFVLGYLLVLRFVG